MPVYVRHTNFKNLKIRASIATTNLRLISLGYAEDIVAMTKIFFAKDIAVFGPQEKSQNVCSLLVTRVAPKGSPEESSLLLLLSAVGAAAASFYGCECINTHIGNAMSLNQPAACV